MPIATASKPKATGKNLPPNLVDKITRGFDVTRWEFCDSHIFQLTYAKRDSGQGLGVVELGGKSYDVPDDTTVVATAKGGGGEASVFRGVHAVDEEAFSVDVSASLSLEAFSASVESSIATDSKIDSNIEKTTTLISAWKIVYTFTRDAPGKLSHAQPFDFRAALDALPHTYTSKHKAKFFDFFHTWGTHYLKQGCFGGNFMMRTVLTKSVLDKMSTQAIKLKVEAGFGEGDNKDSSKTAIESTTKKELGVTTDDSQIDWQVVGGNDSPEKKEFLDSVSDNPVLLYNALALKAAETRPLFEPIWTLARSSYRDAMKLAWKDYIGPAAERQDFIDAPSVCAPDENFKAATDGFLSAFLQVAVDQNGGGSGRAEMHALTDSAANPNTLRSGAAVNVSERSHGATASLFMPVRRGDYYICNLDLRSGSPPGLIHFQPYGLGLGQWEKIALDSLLQCKTDGFVVVTIQKVNNGDRGFVCASQGAGADLKLYAGASVHWYENTQWPLTSTYQPIESCCMPVLKGNNFKVEYTATNGKPDCQAYFVPIGASHRFLPIEPRDADKINTAQTNGVLMGCLHATKYVFSKSTDFGDRDYSIAGLALETADTDAFTKPVLVAAAIALYSEWAERYLPYSAITALIRKGARYRTSFQGQGGRVLPVEGAPNLAKLKAGVTPSLYWVGIAPT